MSVRILITLAVSAVPAFLLAAWAWQAGAGVLGALMVYAFGGSVLTVLVAAVQVVLEPVLLPSTGPDGQTPGEATLPRGQAGERALRAAERA